MLSGLAALLTLPNHIPSPSFPLPHPSFFTQHARRYQGLRPIRASHHQSIPRFHHEPPSPTMGHWPVLHAPSHLAHRLVFSLPLFAFSPSPFPFCDVLPPLLLCPTICTPSLAFLHSLLPTVPHQIFDSRGNPTVEVDLYTVRPASLFFAWPLPLPPTQVGFPPNLSTGLQR